MWRRVSCEQPVVLTGNGELIFALRCSSTADSEQVPEYWSA